MPVAEHFTTLGNHNGFPLSSDDPTEHVIGQWDVSDWDKWTTLSGFNKDSSGSPTEDQIRKSHELAVMFFWYLYRVNCSVISGIVSISEANTVDDVVDPENGDTSELTPKSRGCAAYGFSTALHRHLRVFESHVIDNPGEDDDGDTFEVGVSVGPSAIIAMYDGVTTDEVNFRGYGFMFPSAGVFDPSVEVSATGPDFAGAFDIILGTSDSVFAVYSTLSVVDGSDTYDAHCVRIINTDDDVTASITSVELYTAP